MSPRSSAQLRLDATEVLHPEPLSRAAIEELITAELGGSPSGEFSEACDRATGGNPFLLTEVLRTLGAESTVPDAGAASALSSLGPARVARSALMRLHGFGDEAVSIARAVAVLGGAPQLRHVSALAEVGEERTRDLCDRLRNAELLALGASDRLRPSVDPHRDLPRALRGGPVRGPSPCRGVDRFNRWRCPRSRAAPDGVRAERRSVGSRSTAGGSPGGDGGRSAGRRAPVPRAGAPGTRA